MPNWISDTEAASVLRQQAQDMHDEIEQGDGVYGWTAWERAVDSTANLLAAHNDRFDLRRFLALCIPAGWDKSTVTATVGSQTVTVTGSRLNADLSTK
jgi:hypothetical protein